MIRQSLLASTLISLAAVAALAGCGKQESRSVGSGNPGPTLAQVFTPAAEYVSADSPKVVRKRMQVSGCLYEHSRGIMNLRQVILIEKEGDTTLRFYTVSHFYSTHSEYFNNLQDREDAYVRAVNGWSNCLNDYNATTVEMP